MRVHRLRTAGIFALIALIFGLFFVYKIPLLWGSDETFHMARMYQLSEGKLQAVDLGHSRKTAGYGDRIPENLYNTIINVDRDQMDNATKSTPYGTRHVDDPQLYEALGSKPLNDTHRKVFGFPATAAYSPVAYAPGMIGLYIAKGMGASLNTAVMLIRLCNLFFFIGIGYLTLRILDKKRVKWLFFTIALLPMTIFEASIVSADMMTVGVAMLFSALVIKALLSEEVIPVCERLLLMVTSLTLPLTKPGYVLFVPLILLIPSVRFASWKWMLATKWLVPAVAGVLFIAWSISTQHLADAAGLIRPGEGWEFINPDQQVEYVFHHPLSYILTILRTMILEDTKYFGEIIGTLGFNRVLVPGIVIAVELVLIGLAMAMTERVQGLARKTWCIIIAAISSGILIVSAMYITYTDVAAPLISGIQGRYFLPLLPFLLVGISLLLGPFASLGGKEKQGRILGSIITGGVCFCLLITALKYCYVTWGYLF